MAPKITSNLYSRKYITTTKKLDPKKSKKKKSHPQKKANPTPKLITHKKTKLAEYSINVNKIKIFFKFYKIILDKIL